MSPSSFRAAARQGGVVRIQGKDGELHALGAVDGGELRAPPGRGLGGLLRAYDGQLAAFRRIQQSKVSVGNDGKGRRNHFAARCHGLHGKIVFNGHNRSSFGISPRRARPQAAGQAVLSWFARLLYHGTGRGGRSWPGNSFPRGEFRKKFTCPRQARHNIGGLHSAFFIHGYTHYAQSYPQVCQFSPVLSTTKAEKTDFFHSLPLKSPFLSTICG